MIIRNALESTGPVNEPGGLSRRDTLRLAAASVMASMSSWPVARADQSNEKHGLSAFGDLKYPPGFKHFDYVNPTAPKGGELKQAAVGTFDSFNPFIVRGNPAAGIGQIYDTLMIGSADEPFSEYG